MSLIFDVKVYHTGKNKFEDFGFSIFPLFDTILDGDDFNLVELYVNSGIYSVSTCFLTLIVTYISRKH